MPNIIDASQRKPNEMESTPVLGGGQSGIISPQSPQSNAKSVGSGQFTNLSDYITANQGASQNLGSAIESDVQNKASTAQNQFQQTVNQNKPVAQEFSQARSQFQDYFNKPSLSQSDIQNATNLRTGNTDYQNKYNSAIQNINSAKTGYNREKESLSNLGQGKTLSSYLRGFGENPSAKTMGEVGLTRFLVNQTQPGQKALQTANTIAQNMQVNPQPDIQEISNAYNQIAPDQLQSYSDTQRQNYINSLGNIDRNRAGQKIAGRLGISDIEAERDAFNQANQNFQNVSQQYQQGQDVLNNIANLSEEQLYNILNQEISSSRVNPYRIQSQRNPGMYLENLDFNSSVPVGGFRNVPIINPKTGFYGGLTENLSSKDYNTIILQNRLQNKLPSLQQQQNELQKAIESNKYNQYQSQLQNANTVSSALDPNEIARLQALQQLSGWEGLQEFLGGSI